MVALFLYHVVIVTILIIIDNSEYVQYNVHIIRLEMIL